MTNLTAMSPTTKTLNTKPNEGSLRSIATTHVAVNSDSISLNRGRELMSIRSNEETQQHILEIDDVDDNSTSRTSCQQGMASDLLLEGETAWSIVQIVDIDGYRDSTIIAAEQHPVSNRIDNNNRHSRDTMIEMVEIDADYGRNEEHLELVQIDGSSHYGASDENFEDENEDILSGNRVLRRLLKRRHWHKSCGKKVAMMSLLLMFVLFAGGYGRILWTKNVSNNDEAAAASNATPSRKANYFPLTLSKWIDAASDSAENGKETVLASGKLQQHLINSGGQIFSEDGGREFGKRVAMSGDGNVLAIAVGPRPSDTNDITRKVQTYYRVAEGWQYMGQPVETLHFDNSFSENTRLSFDGSRMVVASPHGTTPDDILNSGYVVTYDFDHASNDWQQVGTTLRGIMEGEHFGRGLAMANDGRRIAVGSPNFDFDTGSVKIFHWFEDDWRNMGPGLPVEGHCFFGQSLAFSTTGNRLAVGAPLATHQISVPLPDGRNATVVPLGAGHVRVYNLDETTAQWQLAAGDAILIGREGFGAGVKLSSDGKTMAIAGGGSRFKRGDVSGVTIQVFTEGNGSDESVAATGGRWRQKGADVVNDGYLDFVLSGNGNRIVFGGACERLSLCHVMVCDFEEAVGWVQIGKSLRSPNRLGDEFGTTLALSENGTQLIVGAMDQTHMVMRPPKGYAAVFSLAH